LSCPPSRFTGSRRHKYPRANTKRKSKKNATPKTPKVRDQPAKKDARGGFGGPVIPKSIAVLHKIHTYTELRQQIHDDLRIQHPEWVEPNGESPMCDFYEARLMKLLDADAKGLN
jgi:hypothetical protein